MVASVRHFGYSRSSGLAPGCVTLEKSVFKKHCFKSLHAGERFRMALFSVIVFGVVVWTIARSRSKTAPFSFENGLVWTGP